MIGRMKQVVAGGQKKGRLSCRPVQRCEHRNARGEVRCISIVLTRYVILVRECEFFTVDRLRAVLITHENANYRSKISLAFLACIAVVNLIFVYLLYWKLVVMRS